MVDFGETEVSHETLLYHETLLGHFKTLYVRLSSRVIRVLIILIISFLLKKDLYLVIVYVTQVSWLTFKYFV